VTYDRQISGELVVQKTRARPFIAPFHEHCSLIKGNLQPPLIVSFENTFEKGFVLNKLENNVLHG
jgi:NifB/MoaA-like Fe-S oxidoreductase